MLFYLILIGMFSYFFTGSIKNIIYIVKSVSDYINDKEEYEEELPKKKTLKE